MFCGDTSRVDDVERIALLVDGLVGGVESVERAAMIVAAMRDGIRSPRSCVILRRTARLLAVNVSMTTTTCRDRLRRHRRGDDVGMAHACREARFVEEHRNELRIGRQVVVQALDG
jgi:hypothetical protein